MLKYIYGLQDPITELIRYSSRDRIHSEESKSKISIANKLAWAKRWNSNGD